MSHVGLHVSHDSLPIFTFSYVHNGEVWRKYERFSDDLSIIVRIHRPKFFLSPSLFLSQRLA